MVAENEEGETDFTWSTTTRSCFRRTIRSRPAGRFASLLVRDRDLAEGLAIGFDGLWKKAMKDLREIEFQPVPR